MTGDRKSISLSPVGKSGPLDSSQQLESELRVGCCWQMGGAWVSPSFSEVRKFILLSTLSSYSCIRHVRPRCRGKGENRGQVRPFLHLGPHGLPLGGCSRMPQGAPNFEGGTSLRFPQRSGVTSICRDFLSSSVSSTAFYPRPGLILSPLDSASCPLPRLHSPPPIQSWPAPPQPAALPWLPVALKTDSQPLTWPLGLAASHPQVSSAPPAAAPCPSVRLRVPGHVGH